MEERERFFQWKCAQNVWGSTILFTKEGIANNNGIESFHSFIFKVLKFEQISTTLCQTLPSGKTTSWQKGGKWNIGGHFSFPFPPAKLKSWSPLVIVGLVILNNWRKLLLCCFIQVFFISSCDPILMDVTSKSVRPFNIYVMITAILLYKPSSCKLFTRFFPEDYVPKSSCIYMFWLFDFIRFSAHEFNLIT